MPTHKASQPPKKKDKNAAYYFSVAGQGLMGSLGLCAGFLYLTPAGECAPAPGCGKWLTDLTSEGVSTGAHFAVGMLSFGVINAYFSFDAIPDAMEFILVNEKRTSKIQRTLIYENSLNNPDSIVAVEEKSQPILNPLQASEDEVYAERQEKLFADYISTEEDDHLIEDNVRGNGEKLLWGTALVGLTGLMTVQLLLVSLRRSPPAWQTMLTVAGGVPGSLYGTVGMIEEIFIPFKNNISYRLERFHARHDKETTSKLNFYAKNLKELQVKVNANWHHIKEQLAYQQLELPKGPGKQPLHFLFAVKAAVPERTKSMMIREGLENVVVLALSYCFTVPFVDSNQLFFEKYIDNIMARYILATTLSSAQIYGNIQLAHHAVASFSMLVTNKVNEKPVDSLMYQLRPRLTMFIFAMEALIASLSYSLVYQTTEEDYQGPVKDEFIYLAMVGIVIYHLGGLMEFANLVFRRFARGEDEKFLIEVEDLVADYNKLTVPEFMELNENDSRFRLLTDVPLYDSVLSSDSPLPISGWSSDSLQNGSNKKTSQSWCCFNKAKKPELYRALDDGEVESGLSNSQMAMLDEQKSASNTRPSRAK